MGCSPAKPCGGASSIARLLNHFLVAAACLCRGTAPFGQGEHAKDADRAAQGERDDLSRAHFLSRFEHPLAVDPDVALVDQRLGEGAAFDQPDAVEIAVDAQR